MIDCSLLALRGSVVIHVLTLWTLDEFWYTCLIILLVLLQIPIWYSSDTQQRISSVVVLLPTCKQTGRP
jgi:uncharacterized membrane protein